VDPSVVPNGMPEYSPGNSSRVSVQPRKGVVCPPNNSLETDPQEGFETRPEVRANVKENVTTPTEFNVSHGPEIGRYFR